MHIRPNKFSDVSSIQTIYILSAGAPNQQSYSYRVCVFIELCVQLTVRAQ